MYAAFYQASRFLDLNLLSSVFFAVFFLGMLAWVATRRRDDCEAEARRPLDSDLAPDASNRPPRPLTSVPENAR